MGQLIDATTLHVLVVVFLATLFRSAFGFGEALIAVPLLALFIPLRVAAPLAVLVSITIAAAVVAQDWRKIHIRSAGWLVSASLLGIPVGLLLLTSTHQKAVKVALALLIIAFAAYSLVGRKPPELKKDSMAWLLGCGFIAGVTGGAYGMNGPPLVIYGAMRRWSAQHFRATLQAVFSSGQRDWDGGVLADGALGCCCDTLLPCVFTGSGACGVAGQSGEPSAAWRCFSEVCLRCSGGDWCVAAGAVGAPVG